MPFPVDKQYIEKTETEMNVQFPADFKARMMKNNGGELESENYDIQLYPFFDESDKKRVSRTCNHIGLETKKGKKWTGFPENGVAIGTDGYGNQIILMHSGNGILDEKVYFWDHESGEVEQIAESIYKLEQ